MREYEIIFIVHPDLDEKALDEVISRVSSWITEDGGEIIKSDIWGMRKLAYPIRKQSEGQYVLMQIKMAPTFGAQLERNMHILESVMRFQLIAL
jgi:small subunit ribosomal protein S6